MCMKENLIHSRTCVYNINYHVVWSVKYRRKILNAEVEKYLKELVEQIAMDKGFIVHLFEVGDGDHIHCFVSAPHKLSVTDIVRESVAGNYLNSSRKSDRNYGKVSFGTIPTMWKP